MVKKFYKLKEKLDLVSSWDILLLLSAILHKEKYGRLSPKTIKRLKVFYEYYKEKNPEFEER